MASQLGGVLRDEIGAPPIPAFAQSCLPQFVAIEPSTSSVGPPRSISHTRRALPYCRSIRSRKPRNVVCRRCCRAAPHRPAAGLRGSPPEPALAEAGAMINHLLGENRRTPGRIGEDGLGRMRSQARRRNHPQWFGPGQPLARVAREMRDTSSGKGPSRCDRFPGADPGVGVSHHYRFGTT